MPQLKEQETPRELVDTVTRAVEGLRAPEPLQLSEWADQHFYLSPESSGIEGRWETLPYQRAIMNVVSNDDVPVVTWMKSARVGYTKIICASIGYNAEHRRRNQVLYQPTDSDAEDFVKDEIDTMLRDVPVVRAQLRSDPDKKSSKNTLSKKQFVGSTLDIKGGKSERNYRRMSKDAAYYDELDGFDRDIEGKGSPVKLGDDRLTTSSFPKSVRGSTPTIKGESLIEGSLAEADKVFHRHIACPKCGHKQRLIWAGVTWTDNDPATAHYKCQKCSRKIHYSEYAGLDADGIWMTDDGDWIDESGDFDVFRNAKGKEIDAPRHVGFHIWAAYSYYVSWVALVQEFLEANAAKKRGDLTKLKSFTNTKLGETWEEEYEQPDSSSLFSRREHYAAEVPDGVCVLTAGVDTQDDRFELEIVGWGRGEESWSIAYERLYGDMGRPGIYRALAEMLRKQYRRVDGTVMDVRMACVDSGGHYTDEVYGFSRKNGVRWVVPVKGASTRGKPIANFPRKPNRKRVYLTEVGTDGAKELIYNRFKVEDPGPGYCHWPIADTHDEQYFEQLTTEKKVTKISKGIRYTDFDAGGRRNEALDCRVYALAAVRVLQQHMGIDLDRLANEIAEGSLQADQSSRSSSFWDPPPDDNQPDDPYLR